MSGLLIQGPRYLRQHLTTPEADLAGKFKIKDPGIEWMGQLISSTHNRQFSIRYYGDLMDEEVIVSDDDVPQKVVAVDVQTKEEIVLFDRSLHGWDGFVINAFEECKHLERPANTVYTSKQGTQSFTIVFVTYYNAGTREELQDEAAPDGTVEIDGVSLPLQDAFDDAFDALTIYAIDEKGNQFQLVNEELA